MQTYRRLVLVAMVLAPMLLVYAQQLEAKQRGGNYISNGSVNLAAVLSPPPARGSAAETAELQALLAAQEARTSSGIAQAQRDRKRSLDLFAEAIGGGFRRSQYPLVDALFDNAIDDARGILSANKQNWQRERPFRLEKRLTTCLKEPESSSYPSSHATSGYLITAMLSDMLPERVGQLAARGDEYAMGRVVCAVHYPSDIRAGQLAARAILARLKADTRFRDDFAKARLQLRAGLGFR